MNRSTPSFRRLFSFTLLVFLLVSCGGKAESDFDVLKKEGEASGEEIPVGTYDSKNIVFAYKNADSPFSATELYVALDYSGESVQSRHALLDIEEYCYFLPELGTGRFQSSTVTFEYEASFDLEDGTASSISKTTASVGTIEAGDTTYVEGFLEAAAESLKDFLDTREEYKSKTEEWLLNKLDDLGYVLTSYDQDSRDYFEGQIYTEHGLTVEIEKLYQGYINQVERWVQMIVFANETQAATYFYKEWSPNGNGNYNYHAHNENIYFFTSSYETIDATFPSTGNRP